MKIGFDAKRAFHNSTGLGNYSRTLISGLANYYPEHEYFLFNPKPSKTYPKPAFENVYEVLPETFMSKNFSAAWRSKWVKKDLEKLHIQLYHGLSHEIPVGIEKTGVASVVTIHDLIFERYPEQFKPIDRMIYRKKFRYACANAGRIIAISKQTRDDIVDLYEADASRIDICYQSCSPEFASQVNEQMKDHVRKKYDLPSEFFLYVGSIIERKNLLGICKALALLPAEINIPLLVIGNGGDYKKKVKDFIIAHQLQDRIIFLSEQPVVKSDPEFQRPKTFAAIYQMATAMIYPSFFEGFGLPVLEALWSGLAVITSNRSCLPETGGDAALYVDPFKPEELAKAMQRICTDNALRREMIHKGWLHAQNFTPEKCTASVMEVYKKLIGD